VHRAIRWVAYALLAWLVVNALAYPFSYIIPKGGTLLQNFWMALLIELVIVALFADVLYIKHVERLKDASQTKGNVARQDLIGTIIEFDYPLIITALFIMIEIALIYGIAF
jgi:hypothetical protein